MTDFVIIHVTVCVLYTLHTYHKHSFITSKHIYVPKHYDIYMKIGYHMLKLRISLINLTIVYYFDILIASINVYRIFSFLVNG